jgi:hypothetical protein
VEYPAGEPIARIPIYVRVEVFAVPSGADVVQLHDPTAPYLALKSEEPIVCISRLKIRIDDRQRDAQPRNAVITIKPNAQRWIDWKAQKRLGTITQAVDK